MKLKNVGQIIVGNILQYYLQLRRAEGGVKIFGVFRVKNHDFTPKNHLFFNCEGRRENFGVFRVKNHDFTQENGKRIRQDIYLINQFLLVSIQFGILLLFSFSLQSRSTLCIHHQF
jgi:hypothetical protein